MKKKYCSCLHIEADKEIGISFPDFPGCVSVGKTIEEAISNGVEALNFHIEGMIEESFEIPMPSAISTINNKIDSKYIVFVDIEIPESRAKRINMTIPEFVISKADNFIKTHPEIKSRSELFSTACLEFCNK